MNLTMNLTSKDSSATSGGGDLADFVVARGPSLHRTALLLTYQGQSAQDLLQVALAKAWRSWAQIGESPEAQVRAIMINEFVSSWRWRRRGELSELPVLPTQGGDDDDDDDDDGDAVSMRQVLMAALAILPRRQRAVVVLRFFHDYTEAATAEALGVKVATVTSQTVKALGALRIFEELRQGATPDLSDSAQAEDVPLQRTLHDLRVALNEQADAAPYPDVGALVAGARRAAATRRPLTVLVATTAGALRNNWLPSLSVFLLIVGVGIGVFLGRVTKADKSPPPDLATTSVTKMLNDLAKAVNAGDAAAIATFYAPSATFNDPAVPDGTGVLTGNTTIADQMASWQERGLFVDSSGTYIQRGKIVAQAGTWAIGSGVVVFELGTDGKIVSEWIIANK